MIHQSTFLRAVLENTTVREKATTFAAGLDQDPASSHIPLEPVRRNPPRSVEVSRYFRWKGLVSRILAIPFLLPGGIITLLLLLMIRLTSKGPALYGQVRVGKHGKTFSMYKLRTMRHDAEEMTGPVWTMIDDPRITWLGHVLRTFHLDELPQLWNVVRGEMDLIGPRPERPEFTTILAEQIPGYMERLKVLPGVTGFAQIKLAPDQNLNSVRNKVELDLHYIENANFFMDFRIFLCTLLRMCGLRRGRASRLLGLDGIEQPFTDLAGMNGSKRRVVTPATVAHSGTTHAPSNGHCKPRGKSGKYDDSTASDSGENVLDVSTSEVLNSSTLRAQRSVGQRD